MQKLSFRGSIRQKELKYRLFLHNFFHRNKDQFYSQSQRPADSSPWSDGHTWLQNSWEWDCKLCYGISYVEQQRFIFEYGKHLDKPLKRRKLPQEKLSTTLSDLFSLLRWGLLYLWMFVYVFIFYHDSYYNSVDIITFLFIHYII